jgi:hypothetical protein
MIRVSSSTTVDASPAAKGHLADQARFDSVITAEGNLTNRINAEVYDTAITPHAPEAVPALFEKEHPEDATALLEGFPSLETVALENVQVLADCRVSVEASITAAGELIRWHDYWVDRDGVLLYAGYGVPPLEDATPAP